MNDANLSPEEIERLGKEVVRQLLDDWEGELERSSSALDESLDDLLEDKSGSGFTGDVKDNLGRVYHYVNGKRVGRADLHTEGVQRQRRPHVEKAIGKSGSGISGKWDGKAAARGIRRVLTLNEDEHATGHPHKFEAVVALATGGKWQGGGSDSPYDVNAGQVKLKDGRAELWVECKTSKSDEWGLKAGSIKIKLEAIHAHYKKTGEWPVLLLVGFNAEGQHGAAAAKTDIQNKNGFHAETTKRLDVGQRGLHELSDPGKLEAFRKFLQNTAGEITVAQNKENIANAAIAAGLYDLADDLGHGDKIPEEAAHAQLKKLKAEVAKRDEEVAKLIRAGKHDEALKLLSGK